MILKENYDGKTTLKRWWQIVRDNFKTIADNAVTKQELSDSVSDAITRYVSEDMTALEDIRKALEENGDVVDVLNSSTASISSHKADNSNPHAVTAEQVGLGNLLNIRQATKNELDAMNAVKTEILFGTYNFDVDEAYFNLEERYSEIFINLGFTPSAVEVFMANGMQTVRNGTQTNYVESQVIVGGGLALPGCPCVSWHSGPYEEGGSGDIEKYINHIEIAENGFYIRDFLAKNSDYPNGKLSRCSYVTRGLHYFKAYKNGDLLKVGEEDDD